MKGWRVLGLLGLVGVCAALCRPAFAQEPTLVEIEVRERMSLLHAGTPVPDARLAFVAPGEGPAEAEASALRTDADGRGRIALPPEGATLLVWKPGFAPAAFRLEGQAARRIALLPERAVTVAVRHPVGDPAVGATVRIAVTLPLVGAAFPDVEAHRFTLEGTTDASGAVTIAGLSEHAVGVTASADGALDVARFPITPDGDAVELDLRHGARVAGTVTTLPRGRPARGALVEIGGRSAEVDESGAFEIDLLEPGLRELRVSGTGFVAPAPLRLVLAERRPREALAIEVLETAGVTGTLHLTAPPGTAAPLPFEAPATFRFTWPPGTGMQATVPRPDPYEVSVTPDVAGGFRIEGLVPADGVTLEVRRAGFAPFVREGLSLRPGVMQEGIWIELARGGVLRGTVTSGVDTPVAGATVTALTFDDREFRAWGAGTTDAVGAFELEGLPMTGVHVDVVPPPGVAAAPRRFGPFEAPPVSGAGPLVLALDGGLSLRGFVADAPPELAAWVHQDGVARGPFEVIGGALAIGGLVPGDARLVLEDARGDALQVDVELPLLSALQLAWRSRSQIVVHLVHWNGAVVPEAVVTVAPDTITATDSALERPLAAASPAQQRISHRNATGSLLLTVLPGRHRLTARAPDGAYGETSVDVLPAGSGERMGPVEIRLERAEAVSGHVFAEATRRPVEGARVQVSSSGAAPGTAGPVGFTDERGWFSVAGVQPGIVRVRVEAPGFAPAVTDAAAVKAGAGLLLGEIELRDGTHVRGHVLAGEGVRTEGLIASLRDPSGRELSTALDRHGRFEWVGALPGPATLTISGPSSRPLHERRIDVPYAEQLEIAVDLADGTIVFGTARTVGRPEAFARIRAVAEDPESGQAVRAETRADARGRFRLRPLPAGPARIEVIPTGTDRSWEFDVVLPRAYDVPIDLDLPEGWLAGEVAEARGGAPVAGSIVTVTAIDPDGGASHTTVAGADGSFRVERLAPGEYLLEASRTGFGAAFPLTVVVPRAEGVTGLLVTLPDEARLTAHVLDRERRSRRSAWLAAESIAEGDATWLRAQADATGAVTLAGLAPGAWHLSAGGAGCATRDLGVVELAPGTFALGEVHLHPESALRVVVLAPGLWPVAGAEVLIEDALGHDPRPPRSTAGGLLARDPRFVTDSLGEVLIAGLAPGVYELSVDGDPQSRTSVRVGLEEIAGTFVLSAPPAASAEPAQPPDGPDDAEPDGTEPR